MIPIAVCIPVCNEAATISTTIDSICGQQNVKIAKILVCANGCTDGTNEIVTKRRTPDPSVRLLSFPWRSKARAWNHLIQAADADYAVFVDGDVSLGANTVARLVDTLQRQPNLVVASARPVPVKTARSGIDRIMLPSPVPHKPLGICGGCYAVRVPLLFEALQDQGFKDMPSAVIAEDRWLALVLGFNRWTTVDDAEVYFGYPALRDLPAQMMRHIRGHHQIQRRYPRLAEQMVAERGVRSTFSAIIREWRFRRSLSHFAQRLCTALVTRGVMIVARFAVAMIPLEQRYTRQWERTPSTKVPLLDCVQK